MHHVVCCAGPGGVREVARSRTAQPCQLLRPSKCPTRLTRAAAMSIMRVGSLRALSQSLKNDLGGIALKRFAPNAALHQDVGGRW